MSSFQDSNTSLEHESFGIKKIVDCKIGENGVQMYKVKWQATWEPAENLASCQQLIEDFWGFVNNAKFKERQRHVLQIQNKSCTDWCIPKLSMETKEEVWNMIAETNKTSSSVQSPSSALRNQQLSTHEQPPTSQRNQVEHEFKNTSLSTKTFHRDNANNVCAKCRNPIEPVSKMTKETHQASSATTSPAGLKYIENFSNPYVKLVVVCKICNKEASKYSRNWKPHYQTHVSNEEKSHPCNLCSAGFVSLTALTKHKEKKHSHQW